MPNLLQNHSVSSGTRYLNTRPDDPVAAGRKLAEKHVSMFKGVLDKYVYKTTSTPEKSKSNDRRKASQS